MKTIITLVVASSLSGCAPRVISSSDRTVVVESFNKNYPESQKLADAECKKYGLSARMAGRPDHVHSEFVYDCVR
jgi:hypothetical protein